MSELSATITNGFTHYFQDFEQRVRRLAEPLTEAEFWNKPYPYGNSFGHLVLHLIGNLNYYIGAQIAGTDYVRHREREFTDSNPPSKEAALQTLSETIALVNATLAAQNSDDWSANYSAVGVDDVTDRFNAFLRCAVHFHHHVGQMIYLNKEIMTRRDSDG